MPLGGGVKMTASMYYSGQSGRPYTIVFYPNVNGDGRFNDLQYIPSSPSDLGISYTGKTYADLAAFMNSDPCLAQYVGKTIPRNACRAPWTNQLDARFAFKLPVKRVSTEVTLDVLNLLNLLDKNWGLMQYASYGEIEPVSTTPSTPTATSQIRVYNLSFLSAPGAQFSRDDLRSRWQMQLGVHVGF